MAVTLPPEAAGMMSMLGPWPGFNEDDARSERDAARTAHAATVGASGETDSAVRGVQQVYRGQAATSVANYWDRTGAQDGHIAQANAATRLTPVALEGTASVVSGVKVAAGTQAVFASVEVAKLLAFGGVVGATAATTRVLLRRRIVGSILREGSEGTGKVLAPLVRRKITEPMRRILDNLRLPGGPMGPRPLAAGPHGGIPLRPTGLRPPSGPRSVEDGIARMGRGNNRSGGGGRGGGGGGGGRRWGSKDRTGKFHGDIPQSTRGMSAAEKEKLKKDLEDSIETREKEQQRLGYEVGHEERLSREKSALRRLFGR
ncbi:hypothetical protein [Streptosporangium sp. NPDC000396]|uniref:hypothetical protein n=1 Tax=Streptosporangium sp. NPDC000396 TaxID=3366185 RepID=UPI0036789FE7